MADYNINAITRRRVFTGSAGVGPYAFTFEILDQGDLAVYFNETKLTITTDYTVTINANGTGSVTLVVNVGGNVPQTPVGSDQIIVVGARDIERVTDFVTAGDLLASSLNEQLDALTSFDQQLAEEGQRSMRAPVYDPALVADGGTLDMTLPAKADRVDAVLAFDTDGNPIKGPTVSGITTMTALAADITTLADIEDGTVATDAISNTATVVSDIPTVAGIASNVTTVAGISSDVTTVANNVSDVTAFAQIYRVGSTDPTSNNDVGDLFYNTTSDTLKIWQGSAWVIAASEISGYLPVTGGTITGDLTLSGGSGNDILFDQSRKILHFKDGTKAAFGLIPSSSANPNTADIEIYRNNLEGAVIGFADTSTAAGTKIPSFIKNTTADVNYIQFTPTQDVALFYNGVEKFATENTGVGVIGDINVSGLVDGRDVAADGTKLDGIEASADVTDAGNVNPLVDAHLNQSTAANGEVLSWNGSDYDWVAQTGGGGGDLLAANNLSDLDNAATARTNLGVAIGSDVQAHSSVLDGTTASFTTAKDSKLTGIEAGADVTDTINVTAAGALMDSEVDADIKTLSLPANTTISAYGATLVDDATASAARTTLGLGTAATTASTDYATAAQGTTADAALPRTGGAMTGAITTNSTFDGRDVGVDGAKLDGIEAGADVTDAANVEPLVDSHLNTSTAATNEVLSWNGTDYDWVAQSGGGGADLYAANESSPAAQPSATGGNAIAIGDSAVSVGADAFAGPLSRAGGGHSIAMGIQSNSSSYGSISSGGLAMLNQAKASGSFASIAIGDFCQATDNRAVSIGAQNIASQDYASIIGGRSNTASAQYSTCVGGYLNTASKDYSVAMGYQSVANKIGQKAFASGRFAANGDAQGSQFILRADTTDATATVLTTNNSTAAADNQIVAASDTCITFDGTIVAMQNGAQAFASFKIEGLLVNDGGTTTLANSATTIIDNQSSWGLALSADNTNNALAITVTGEALHNIRWVANIRTSEVTYA